VCPAPPPPTAPNTRAPPGPFNAGLQAGPPRWFTRSAPAPPPPPPRFFFFFLSPNRAPTNLNHPGKPPVGPPGPARCYAAQTAPGPPPQRQETPSFLASLAQTTLCQPPNRDHFDAGSPPAAQPTTYLQTIPGPAPSPPGLGPCGRDVSHPGRREILPPPCNPAGAAPPFARFELARGPPPHKWLYGGFLPG